MRICDFERIHTLASAKYGAVVCDFVPFSEVWDGVLQMTIRRYSGKNTEYSININYLDNKFFLVEDKFVYEIEFEDFNPSIIILSENTLRRLHIQLQQLRPHDWMHWQTTLDATEYFNNGFCYTLKKYIDDVYNNEDITMNMKIEMALK